MRGSAAGQAVMGRQEFLRTLMRWGLVGGLAALGAALLRRGGSACRDATACGRCRLHALCFTDQPTDGGTR